jgi:AcrR family transcriptional regulator
MGQVRARQIHEKEARRQEILGAAARLWDRLDFPELSMALIAQEAALAKGTLYLYFRTKEELFLAMTEEELLSWYEEIDEALARGRKEMESADLARLLARSLAARPRLPRLLAILHTVLERNIEHLTALRFKQFQATRILRSGRLLERRLPFLAEGQGPLLLLRVHALVLGFWQMADAAPVVKKLLDAPGLHLFRVEFAESMESALSDLVAGMKSAVTATTGSAG